MTPLSAYNPHWPSSAVSDVPSERDIPFRFGDALPEPVSLNDSAELMPPPPLPDYLHLRRGSATSTATNQSKSSIASKLMSKLGRPFTSKSSPSGTSPGSLPSSSLPVTPISATFNFPENVRASRRPSAEVEERSSRTTKRKDRSGKQKPSSKVQEKRSKSKPKPVRMRIDVPAPPRRSTSAPSLRQRASLADLDIEEELNQADMERAFTPESDPFAKGEVELVDAFHCSPSGSPSRTLGSAAGSIYSLNDDYYPAPERIPLPLTPTSPEFGGFSRSSSQRSRVTFETPKVYGCSYEAPHPPTSYRFPAHSPKGNPPSPRRSSPRSHLERAILAYPTPELEDGPLDKPGLRPRLSSVSATRQRLLRRESAKAAPTQPLPAPPMRHFSGCSADFGGGLLDEDSASTPKANKTWAMQCRTPAISPEGQAGRASCESGSSIGLGLVDCVEPSRMRTPEPHGTTGDVAFTPPQLPSTDNDTTPVRRSPGKTTPPSYRMAKYVPLEKHRGREPPSSPPSYRPRHSEKAPSAGSASSAGVAQDPFSNRQHLRPDSERTFDGSIGSLGSFRKSGSLSITSRSPAPSLSEFPCPPLAAALSGADSGADTDASLASGAQTAERQRSRSGRSGSPFPFARSNSTEMESQKMLEEPTTAVTEDVIMPGAYIEDLSPPADGQVRHKPSFPFEHQRQRFLSEMDLMFTPRSRESSIAGDDHEGSVCFSDPWMMPSGASSRAGSVNCLSDDGDSASIGRLCMDMLSFDDDGEGLGSGLDEDLFEDARDDSGVLGEDSTVHELHSFREKGGRWLQPYIPEFSNARSNSPVLGRIPSSSGRLSPNDRTPTLETGPTVSSIFHGLRRLHSSFSKVADVKDPEESDSALTPPPLPDVLESPVPVEKPLPSVPSSPVSPVRSIRTREITQRFRRLGGVKAGLPWSSSEAKTKLPDREGGGAERVAHSRTHSLASKGSTYHSARSSWASGQEERAAEDDTELDTPLCPTFPVDLLEEEEADEDEACNERDSGVFVRQDGPSSLHATGFKT
ncbi:hypothetical protein PUNSTDRAFT_139885 [Punctularia strigosozonata HHB-11173 SS5]|uniref:uncharacterized protein n=1 Tax=Punctularia strigosozonata (strain HHB-11173) TaxID=741275 RepID=UPI000441738F|nr:uncharacterized protein PUNSTDRAFT_139885 [Punctularia strigosozonata HHB-11173 SS5]EIN13288.1 hypothetical protein PUNSTDRAFT_139885 [Punctularia strigosozonata HHB-11173 SS5]